MSLSHIENTKLVTGSMIGFFGCEWLDRIVSVGLANPQDRTPRGGKVVKCPCGRDHKVRVLMWREAKWGEAPEVFIEG